MIMYLHTVLVQTKRHMQWGERVFEVVFDLLLTRILTRF